MFIFEDIALISVNRSSIVDLFEGSPNVSYAPGSSTPSESLIGAELKVVWPDAQLLDAVQRILDEKLVW